MFFRSFKRAISHFAEGTLICLMLQGGSGCGGDPAEEEAAALEGPFAQITGDQSRTLAISPEKMKVVCTPKLGLKEFEFEAVSQTGVDAGTYLRFTIGNYLGPGDYVLEYDPSRPIHKVEVGLTDAGLAATEKIFKYRLFQELRLDNKKLYTSYCNLRLNAEELQTKTRFAGTINCIMLWADFDSSASKNGSLTSYIDLVAKYECEY